MLKKLKQAYIRAYDRIRKSKLKNLISIDIDFKKIKTPKQIAKAIKDLNAISIKNPQLKALLDGNNKGEYKFRRAPVPKVRIKDVEGVGDKYKPTLNEFIRYTQKINKANVERKKADFKPLQTFFNYQSPEDFKKYSEKINQYNTKAKLDARLWSFEQNLLQSLYLQRESQYDAGNTDEGNIIDGIIKYIENSTGAFKTQIMRDVENMSDLIIVQLFGSDQTFITSSYITELKQMLIRWSYWDSRR